MRYATEQLLLQRLGRLYARCRQQSSAQLGQNEPPEQRDRWLALKALDTRTNCVFGFAGFHSGKEID